MHENVTRFAGIEVPSTDPVFLAIVAIHILLGMTAVTAGAAAMFSRKAPGRHPRFGTLYFWSLTALVTTAGALSFMRWEPNRHLFLLGAFALAFAVLGREARRRRWSRRTRLHLVGMGSSYVLMLTAFYVDNGRQLPLWKELPPWAWWTLPTAIGVPIMLAVLFRHPLTRAS